MSTLVDISALRVKHRMSTVVDISALRVKHRMSTVVDIRALSVNPLNAEYFLYKPWRPKGFIQFEIIINVLVTSF